jgi:hypothetical protein
VITRDHQSSLVGSALRKPLQTSNWGNHHSLLQLVLPIIDKLSISLRIRPLFAPVKVVAVNTYPALAIAGRPHAVQAGILHDIKPEVSQPKAFACWFCTVFTILVPFLLHTRILTSTVLVLPFVNSNVNIHAIMIVEFSLVTLLWVGTIISGFCAVFTIIYRFLFHPLAAFPGPRLAIVTFAYEWYYDLVLGGQYTFKLRELHKKYGKSL